MLKPLGKINLDALVRQVRVTADIAGAFRKCQLGGETEDGIQSFLACRPPQLAAKLEASLPVDHHS